jgi:FMN-dependent NADH-azoreductase
MPDSNSVTVSKNAITAEVIQEEGAGKAFQAVAQSTALAVQDAVDNLRNINTIITTAQGVIIAQSLANPAYPTIYKDVIDMVNKMPAAAIQNFTDTGTAAAAVLTSYKAVL